MSLYIKHITTPIGELIAASTLEGICLLEFNDQKSLEKDLLILQKKLETSFINTSNVHIEKLEEELDAYFNHNLINFTVEIDMVGTDFQKQVWTELLKIPYGTTISYQQQAININRQSAIRAIANANSKNKICIIIPCHRVIGNNGELTGYAGGLQRKRYLIDLENKYIHTS